MAKDETTNAEPAEEAGTDLATLGDVTGTLARPRSLGIDDVSGTESIDPNTVRLPRLTIAQGLSKQLIMTEPNFIQGLTMFDMFNDISTRVYGKGPITFVTITRQEKRMQFAPRNEGGGMIDPNVPKGDPRLKWTWSSPELKASGAKADVPPQAVEIPEYVILLLQKGQQPEPIVLGIALKNKWNRRAEDAIKSTLAIRTAPIYANMFSIATDKPASNDKGTFGVPNIRDLGYIPMDSPAGKALFEYSKKLHEQLKGKNIVSDVQNPEDIDDSMAANPEGGGEPVGPSGPAGQM